MFVCVSVEICGTVLCGAVLELVDGWILLLLLEVQCKRSVGVAFRNLHLAFVVVGFLSPLPLLGVLGVYGCEGVVWL